MSGSGATHQMAFIPIRWELIHDKGGQPVSANT